jgi:phenylalanyl-tRNA synthetase beta chain
MLCSPDELGLSSDESILLEIDGDRPAGEDLGDALELSDHVLSIALNPNRPDCLGIIGIAREVALLAGSRLKMPSFKVRETGPPVKGQSDVRIEAPDLCPRYVLRLISGCKAGQSPLWMAKRLLACDLRPISNLVDVTNYVMFELGQPLHAFDIERLEEKRIVVRRAKKGETMTTLDGGERKLSPDLLVIADASRPVAVAGVMGGEASGICDSTETVLLESAYFNPGAIRSASKYLGLSTDSSHRFERGVDYNMTPLASARAAQLIAELSGGDVAAGSIDAYPRKRKPVSVRYRPERASAILGCKVPVTEQKRILHGLGFSIEAAAGKSLRVGVPSYRVDMDREIDLIEEVGRHYGYHRIPSRLFAGIDLPLIRTDKERMRERLTGIMIGFGFNQVLTTSLIDGSAWRTFREKSVPPHGVVLMNPLSSDQAYLRPSLIPTMSAVVRHNLNAGFTDVRLFEIGVAFQPTGTGKQPSESERLTALVAGSLRPPSWNDPVSPADLFAVKGLAEALTGALRVPSVRFREVSGPEWAGSVLNVISGRTTLGAVGALAEDRLKEMEIETPVFFLDLLVDRLVAAAIRRPMFASFPRMPAAKRDLAVIVPDDVSAARVEELIKSLGGDRLESLTLFDFYRGRQVKAGCKSLAYSLAFRDPERTLTDEEIDSIVARILRGLNKEHGIELRS